MSSTPRRSTLRCPWLFVSSALLALTSACSGANPAPVDPALFEMDAGPGATDDGGAADPTASDASTVVDSGPTATGHDAGSSVREAGTSPVRDAGSSGGGTVHVSCNQIALGVCQSATVATSMEASWRSMCNGTADPCPSTDLVGCCVGDTNHYCYYGPQYTVSTAKQGCSIMGGTWSTTL